uniref:Uncharacterized protein n=1 Tax=Arundo donax TaxID=35708 RepID=A0A0A9B4Y4_ARUDO
MEKESLCHAAIKLVQLRLAQSWSPGYGEHNMSSIPILMSWLIPVKTGNCTIET